MKSKRLHYLVVILLLIPTSLQFSQISFAQVIPEPPETTVVPLPVGSGARAIGMGGAFIAVADDATAASWNPGGLTQLERPELSVVGTYLSAHQDVDTSNNELFFDNKDISRSDLNFASVVYPFRVFRKNLVIALGYQRVYDFHYNEEHNHITKSVVLPGVFINQKVDFESKGGISALTPAIALQVMPRLSIGVAVNFYTDEYFDDVAWKQKSTEKFSITIPGAKDIDLGTRVIKRKFKNFQAINVVSGMLWDVWERDDRRLTLGAVYHSPYAADVDSVTESTEDPLFPNKEQYEIDFPMSFGAGLSFRYNDTLSFSMDVTWTDWSEYEQEDEYGNKTRPFGGVSTDRDIDDTYAVRLGGEYLIFGQKMIIPVRSGLFYDPRPSLDDPADVYGFSVGSGMTFKRFSIDAAYQFRWVNNVDGEDVDSSFTDTKFDHKEHLFYASMIVYF